MPHHSTKTLRGAPVSLNPKTKTSGVGAQMEFYTDEQRPQKPGILLQGAREIAKSIRQSNLRYKTLNTLKNIANPKPLWTVTSNFLHALYNKTRKAASSTKPRIAQGLRQGLGGIGKTFRLLGKILLTPLILFKKLFRKRQTPVTTAERSPSVQKTQSIRNQPIVSKETLISKTFANTTKKMGTSPKFLGEQMEQAPPSVINKDAETHNDTWQQIMQYTQTSVLILLGILIVGSVGITLMSALGVIPWLEIAATLGGLPIPGLGPTVQILFTLFCASLLAFLPASARILKLEKSHREFNLTLADIEHAYRSAHAEDREGVFTLSDEFGAVRERLSFLHKHPNLSHLEPEILETAAQMSFLSRDLAKVYSDDSVARAKSFLAQRQEEITRHSATIDAAVITAKELRRWQDDLDAEERHAVRQIERLEADLAELLPKIKLADDHASATVLSMPRAKVAKRRDLAELN